jgi:hypothetical protein
MNFVIYPENGTCTSPAQENLYIFGKELCKLVSQCLPNAGGSSRLLHSIKMTIFGFVVQYLVKVSICTKELANCSCARGSSCLQKNPFTKFPLRIQQASYSLQNLFCRPMRITYFLYRSLGTVECLLIHNGRIKSGVSLSKTQTRRVLGASEAAECDDTKCCIRCISDSAKCGGQ